MNPIYANLIEFGLGLSKQFLSSLTKSNAPAQVIDAVSAAVDALQKHWNDDVTKANLESMRG